MAVQLVPLLFVHQVWVYNVDYPLELFLPLEEAIPKKLGKTTCPPEAPVLLHTANCLVPLLHTRLSLLPCIIPFLLSPLSSLPSWAGCRWKPLFGQDLPHVFLQQTW